MRFIPKFAYRKDITAIEMDEVKYKKLLGLYHKWCMENTKIFNKEVQERKTLVDGMQALTKERISQLTKEDIEKLLLSLWAAKGGPMRYHTIPNVIKDYGEETIRKQLSAFLYGQNPIEDRWDNFNLKGLKESCKSEILLKFRPKECIVWNKTTQGCFNFLGIDYHSGNINGKKYVELCNVGKELVKIAKEQGIPEINDLMELNYFFYYMMKQDINGYQNEEDDPMKPEQPEEITPHLSDSPLDISPKSVNGEKPFSVKSLTNIIKETGLIYSDALIKRFTFSLMAKRFLILSGLAGSGKTQLALTFAYALTTDKSQVCVVPVGADWTNREPLLGFPDALRHGEYIRPDNGALDLLIEAGKVENSEKPYFLILDEMNMSYVERYFADFLSAMESGEPIALWTGNNNSNIPPRVTLPDNLFIIGTINVDETTYMFSPKVLDRANVIEFKIAVEEMGKYLDEMKPVNRKIVNGRGSDMAASFVSIAKDKQYGKDESINSALKSFFGILKEVNAEFGYRSAAEIFRFISKAKSNDDTDKPMNNDDILDCAVVQKLLPKLHGSRKRLEPTLQALWKLCMPDVSSQELTAITAEGIAKARYKLSADKVRRMYEAAYTNGFTSFAEA